MAIINVTKENFEEKVINSKTPVLLDFWAPWCMYCRRLEPLLDVVEEEQGDNLVIAKLNIDDEPELTEKYNVDTIPTLLLFRNGTHGEMLIAPGSKSQLDDFIGN